MGPARVKVYLEDDSYYFLDVKHYDDLKNELDANEKGWREYDSMEHPSGKVNFKLENVIHYLLATQDFIKAFDEIAAEEKAKEMREG